LEEALAMTTPADHPDHSAPSRVDRRADDLADDHGADLSDAVRGRDEGFDLARLREITDRDGYAVFDPTAPGGVRSLSLTEQHALTDSIRSDQRLELKSGPDDADMGRHSESPYRLAAERGDPDYREPASDAEAAARTDYVHEHFPATGWTARANTEIEDALDDASERAVLSDRAHDPDPQAWAEYHRLLALDQLAPLPTDRDTLDDPPHREPGQGDDSDDTTQPQNDWHHEDRVPRDHLADEAAQSGGSSHDGPFTDTQGRRWASTGAWAAGTCDPANATDTTHPDDPERLRRRVEDLRAELAIRDDAPPDMEEELRREQLARWHDDDAAGDGLDGRGETPDDGEGRAGWGP
jgi:hypothetical protein